MDVNCSAGTLLVGLVVLAFRVVEAVRDLAVFRRPLGRQLIRMAARGATDGGVALGQGAALLHLAAALGIREAAALLLDDVGLLGGLMAAAHDGTFAPADDVVVLLR